ncbi:MAG: hypothetical protein JNM63_15965, partial [Spirochaetia bacterium]|nr:hypothetical protein [Spirochaetia bacterium]
EETDGKMWLCYYQQYPNGQLASYELFNDGLSGAMGGFSHDFFSYDGFSGTGVWNASSYIPSTHPDFHLYTSGNNGVKSLDTVNQMRGMAMLLMDGFYFAEARHGSLAEYPSQGNGGYEGHLLVMDPKACPYAPRVDPATDTRIQKKGDAYQFPVRITSPTILPMENFFLPETIHGGTVHLSDSEGKTIPSSSIEYTPENNTITVSTFSPLSPKNKYQLTLLCGVDGIKNSRGASLINTKSNEFKDEISLEYVFPDAGLSAEDGSGTSAGASPGAPGNSIVSLNPGPVFQYGKNLAIQFALKAGAQNASLEIYSLHGAKIKVLKGDDLDQTAHRGRWDGLPENGDAKSGIYFVVLRVDGRQEDMKKVIFLRSVIP